MRPTGRMTGNRRALSIMAGIWPVVMSSQREQSRPLARKRCPRSGVRKRCKHDAAHHLPTVQPKLDQR